MAQKEKGLLYRFIRKLLIFIISLGIVISSVYMGVNFVYSKYIMPVDSNNTELVEIEIPRGSSLDAISQILYDNNLIRSKTAFKLYVDVSNKTSQLKAGKYKLSRNMELGQIMDELLAGNAASDTVTITIIEGWDIRKIARYLVKEKEFQFTEQEFIDAAKVENFTDFVFLQDIPEERKKGEVGTSPLEGYLFPDTYIVYQDASPEDIMRKMLVQFEKVYNESVLEKAQALEMTMDEVVTLASVIQREARMSEDFAKISAVFHNRLNKEMPLGSCATVQFLINEDRWILTEEEMNIDSPYNTYINKGLPIGPIASPGRLALVSAVNPYEEFMDPKKPYLYFVLKDPKTGEHVFNTDYDQHLKDKEKYEGEWSE
ncbi:MAG: endolytic transglycosylase MltG [Clostridiales bacterium]|nr:endolytic transglycosylase MltG [Clostridiales bacterium]